MGFKCGIVGLPNVGKSTLFNCLSTSAKAEAANYPFCTIEPNVSKVSVPDKRLDKLTELVKPENTLPAFTEFVDIAGLVKGASQGEGLGNKFLANIRETQVIVHVVRCFEDENITHVEGSINPVRDVDIIETELMLADMETVDKSLERAKKIARSGDKEKILEAEGLERIKAALDAGKWVHREEWDDNCQDVLKGLHLLTNKPVLYVANVDDISSGTSHSQALEGLAKERGEAFLVLSGKMEEEILELEEEERKEYLSELGVTESGLHRMINEGYRLLGLITYFTAGEKEVRAWTIRNGWRAPQAAGVIHTDFEKGFIRAETCTFDDYEKLGSEAKIKEAGLLRQEGKDYVVKDGDVLHFKFNV